MYSPGLVPLAAEDLSRFIQNELRAIANEMANSSIEFRNVAPEKPREGMLYGADGVNWNPGGGQGVYCYYGGAWTKL